MIWTGLSWLRKGLSRTSYGPLGPIQSWGTVEKLNGCEFLQKDSSAGTGLPRPDELGGGH
jgi:hypothetical protein